MCLPSWEPITKPAVRRRGWMQTYNDLLQASYKTAT
jgi:hypothetical protein